MTNDAGDDGSVSTPSPPRSGAGVTDDKRHRISSILCHQASGAGGIMARIHLNAYHLNVYCDSNDHINRLYDGMGENINNKRAHTVPQRSYSAYINAPQTHSARGTHVIIEKLNSKRHRQRVKQTMTINVEIMWAHSTLPLHSALSHLLTPAALGSHTHYHTHTYLTHLHTLCTHTCHTAHTPAHHCTTSASPLSSPHLSHCTPGYHRIKQCAQTSYRRNNAHARGMARQ